MSITQEDSYGAVELHSQTRGLTSKTAVAKTMGFDEKLFGCLQVDQAK